jgi:hypothetical protein
MTRKSALLFVILVLASSSAFSREKDIHLGVYGDFVMYGNVRGSEPTERLMVPSGGAGIVCEYALLDYITLGGSFDYNAAYTKGSAESPWKTAYTPYFGFSATMKTGYPFLKKKNLDVYVRWTAGYGLFNFHSGDIDHGWVGKVLPGVQYTSASGFTVFTEMGWAGAGYIDNTDTHRFFNGLAFNLGIGWVFK